MRSTRATADVPLVRALSDKFDHRENPDLIPAASVAVLDRGRLTTVAWGAGPKTLFQAASISKPVAAFAALRLVDQGRIGLDDELNSRLRGWKLKGQSEWAPTVTLRQLLSHGGATAIAGFPGYRREPLPTLGQILDGLPPANTAPVRVLGVPGLMTNYSGGGFTVLQKLLEDVTGTSFRDVVGELVLRPARMTEATFEDPLGSTRQARAVPGYVGGKPLAGGWHSYPELAAAGMWCTPTDLVHFAAAVQASASGEDAALLPTSLASLMISPEFPGVGLGLRTRGTGPNRYFGHTGGNEGYRCEVLGSAQTPVSAAVMINSNEGSISARDLIDAVTRVCHWPIPIANDLMTASFRGTFRTAAGFELDIERQNQELIVRVLGQPAIRLAMENDRKAVATEPPLVIALDYDLAGSVAAAAIHQLDGEVVAYRLQPTESDMASTLE